jgi:arabinogalactan endo-1,4-beta-galactosidase
MRYQQFFFSFFLFFNALACTDSVTSPKPDDLTSLPIRAVDISFYPELRSASVLFKDAAGVQRDLLEILKDAGVNTIRLRVWHTPDTNVSGLPAVKIFVEELKEMGFKIWLSVHYSDWWADPGSQTKPAAWQQLSSSLLHDSVTAYTRKIMVATQPDYIQIGNEINGGFLWPTGSTTAYATFISLLKAGASAVRAVNANTKILVHYAGIEFAPSFYDAINTQQVDYDIAAVSYYPWWHGKDLSLMRSKLSELRSLGKDVVIAETAYPFTLGWNDWTNNIVGLDNQLISNIPATQEGQYEFLLQVREMVAQSGGIGFAYWAPEWVAYKGTQGEDASSWENLCLFDFSNKALPALEVFKE